MSRPPRVFLIEDDAALISIVRETVKAEGWEFSDQRMLMGAWEALQAFAPDIVLLDLGLPDGEGRQICERLRAERRFDSVPVIILTSRDDVRSRLQGFSAGAQDYVTKPFVMAELLARIRAHLSIKHRQDGLERAALDSCLRERVRQDLTDMIVHDLKAPLSTIKFTLRMLEQSAIPTDVFLNATGVSIDIALFMVNDLMDLQIGKLKVVAGSVSIPDLMERVRQVMGIQFQTKNLELRLDIAAAPRRMVTDQMLLFRILVNILSNAIKFSPARASVRLRAQPHLSGLRVEVEDSGFGVPDGEKETIFEKFYRSSTVEAQCVPGAGIGLAFCRMAATATPRHGKGGVSSGQAMRASLPVV